MKNVIFSSGRPTALPVQFQNIPQDLKSISRWVLWRNVQRTKPDGTKVWAKVPFQVNDHAASTSDASTWTTYDEVADKMLKGRYDGIGLILGDDVQGIDLDDCRDPSTGVLSDLAQEVLDKIEGYAEVSPSGTGIKLFTKTNLDGSRTKKEVGVEMYRDGRYFTVTGHSLNGHNALPIFEQDVGWFVKKVWDDSLSEQVDTYSDAGERALALFKPPLEGWDLDRVVDEILPYLDPDVGYAEWLQVGQVLHHQGEGAEDWMSAWDQWSAGSSKWIEGHCEEKWKSFHDQRHQGRGVMTLASLIKKTKPAREKAARAQRDSALDTIKQAVAACTDVRDLQDQIAANIAKSTTFSDVEREMLASAIQTKAKDLGVKLPISTVRSWVRPRTQQGNSNMPGWAQPWVYVTEGDKFFNTDTKQEVTSQGFRAMFNRFMPINQDGNRERADLYCTEQWGMAVVSHKTYMPGMPVTFEMFGLQWVNLYRPESVPTVPAQYSQEDLDAIDTVKQHLEC
ncbi:PriCT-2 domain-containing protein [Limnohabitans sp.]|uniref:PriCT-2 domain-containing protein n=1 Tax=Limnohabitans sp. TaxID=1907725 RepID=UPI00286F9DAE|nr:PriCT-2 domain-containing protein [Limnohabitans sp.]